MKKFINFMVMLTTCLLSLVTQTSCENFKQFKDHYESADSAYIAAVVESHIEDYANPTFTNVPAVMDYYEKYVNDNETYSIFVNMPEQAIINVTEVLLRTSGKCTVKDIVTEYTNNIHIYSNLPGTKESEAPSPSDSNKIADILVPDSAKKISYVELEEFRRL